MTSWLQAMGGMVRLRGSVAVVARHPVAFLRAVLKGFRANQGLLLAGAVAYYTLLSLIPLLILVLIALSHVIDEARLLATLREYLEFVVPGQSGALVEELRAFLAHRDALGGVLLGTMLFFSALAFTVLENAMSVIFFHRVAVRRRHFLVSATMPYLFILFLAVGLLVITVVAGRLEWLARRDISMFGELFTLSGLSATLLYIMGVLGEIVLLTAIYLVMPVGRLSLRHALIGGVAAGLLWELTRHALVWYYSTLSQIQTVYGSLTTAIATLLSVEIAALVLLLGAQVISEYERIGREPVDATPSAVKLDQPQRRSRPPRRVRQ
ncbi:MAG TPA: YihY/virulence factor BrkB family protein [Casimicrobiaceae bacterium]|nr:YihY/virulence factor BrkB family protein [Casimicrobiaceae bacterium]